MRWDSLRTGRACRLMAAVLAVVVWLATPILVARAQPPEPGPNTIVHIVQQGDTLSSIARRYGATVDAIAHTNGIADPSDIHRGQRLVIPERGRIDVEDTASYVVAAGESLHTIAARYHTTWQTLAEINGLLSPSVAYPGQVIRVPGFGHSAEQGTPEGWAVGGMIHVVRPSDTLFRIAVQHGVSTWAVLGASNVANPALIYPGQELLIPGAGSGFLPAPFLWVDVRPLPVSQGTTAVVAVRTTEPVTLTGAVLDQQISFSDEAGAYYGLIGVHVFTEAGLYELVLDAVDGQGEHNTLATGIVVESGDYWYERINVPAARAGLLEADVVAAEYARLEEVVHTYTTERRWTGLLRKPGGGTVSSYFGTHRSYGRGDYTSYHTGTDFRGPTGTPVIAAAPGTVVLAEELAIHGNMVIVDHGWGLLTGYAHLSAIDVAPGQEVAAGDQIGRIGNTGLSTAAHLHWEVWVNGISVDGLQWLDSFYSWPEQDAGETSEAAGPAGLLPGST